MTKNPDVTPLVHRPLSATSTAVACCGLGAFIAAIVVVRYIHMAKPTLDTSYLALFVMFAMALGVFLPDLFWQKIYKRIEGYGAQPPSPSWHRTLTKFAGLLGSMGFIALIYWLFPEYRGSFYNSYYAALAVILLPWLLLAVPYIRWVDARMLAPEDRLWHMGCLVTLQWRRLDVPSIRQHLLGWLVKGFFLPLMFTYLCQDLSKFITIQTESMHGFKAYYDFLYNLFYFVDVCLCSCGYLFTLRLTDTHIRSTDPTMSGWMVALICYDPFWTFMGSQYLAYDSGYEWGDWLHVNSVAYIVWGVIILALILIYVSASLTFGMRFSNLTHRGILTNGPYRWSKHPAYISKNISWWLISVPFIVNGTVGETLRHVLLLMLLSAVYFLRAKTEERHLLRDPVYVQYAKWIEANGLLAILGRFLAGFRKRT